MTAVGHLPKPTARRPRTANFSAPQRGEEFNLFPICRGKSFYARLAHRIVNPSSIGEPIPQVVSARPLDVRMHPCCSTRNEFAVGGVFRTLHHEFTATVESDHDCDLAHSSRT